MKSDRQKHIRVLAVEDDPGDADLLLRALDMNAAWDVDCVHHTDPARALAELPDLNVDVIFLDYHLGSTTGLEVLQQLRRNGDLRAVIALTGCGDEYTAAHMALNGADAYVSKSDLSPEVICTALNTALARAEDRRLLHEQQTDRAAENEALLATNRELIEATRLDSMTNLLNHKAWKEALDLEHERASRSGCVYSVILLDIDYFKQYNDSCGHPAGDDCLMRVAACLKDACRRFDIVGRYGGEEFAVLAVESGQATTALLAERLRQALWNLNLPHPDSQVADRVTASFGVASGPADGCREVISNADKALYAAKHGGRNRIATEWIQEMWDAPAAAQQQLVILAIDDDPADAELLHRTLQQIPGFEFEYLHCADADAGRGEVLTRRVDVVFLDYQLGASTGLEALKSLRSTGFMGAVVVLTGQGDEQIAAQLMRAGADDYLIKNDLGPEVLRRALANAEAQRCRRETQERNARLISELHAAQRTLESKNRRLAELNQTAYHFVDNASHEFRTPLAVIREYTAMLGEGLFGDVNEQQAESIQTVLRRVDDLCTMVDDMLDISRIEAGVLGLRRTACRVADIFEHIRATLESRAASSLAELQLDCSDDTPVVYCDPEKISRVIINLTVNALKFCRDHGQVRVWTQWQPGAASVRVGVTDDGPGIAAEELKAIFERFKQSEGNVRAASQGFGLGLNIARELVHLNFGDLGLDSTLGSGSTFYFSIPCADAASLLKCYKAGTPGFREDTTQLHLLRAVADDHSELDELDELDAFFHLNLRCNDLILRTQPHEWLLLGGGGVHEAGPFAERLREDYTRISSRGSALASFELHSMGSWPLAQPGSLSAGLAAWSEVIARMNQPLSSNEGLGSETDLLTLEPSARR